MNCPGFSGPPRSGLILDTACRSYQTGWIDAKPGHADGPVWGEERKLVTRPDPEFYASDNLIRSNVIPVINIKDPIYSFSREKHTFTV